MILVGGSSGSPSRIAVVAERRRDPAGVLPSRLERERVHRPELDGEAVDEAGDVVSPEPAEGVRQVLPGDEGGFVEGSPEARGHLEDEGEAEGPRRRDGALRDVEVPGRTVAGVEVEDEVRLDGHPLDGEGELEARVGAPGSWSRPRSRRGRP